MKLFSRRIKGYLIIFVLAFLLSYFLISYVTQRSNQILNIETNSIFKETNINNGGKQQSPKPEQLETRRYYASDGNGRASVNREVIKCSPGLEVEVVDFGNQKSNFSYFLDSVPGRSAGEISKRPRHYYMVYAMESEPHSGGHDTWHSADFFMWYNLDMSFPEPATYFDVHTFLPDLLAPPVLEFEKKSEGDLANLAWVLSNCNAFNRREAFVKKLMSLMNVDSYGFCLRNKDTHTSQRYIYIYII